MTDTCDQASFDRRVDNRVDHRQLRDHRGGAEAEVKNIMSRMPVSATASNHKILQIGQGSKP